MQNFALKEKTDIKWIIFGLKCCPHNESSRSVYSKWYWMATNNLYMQFGWPFTQPHLVSPSSISSIFMCKVKAQGCKLFPDLRGLKCGSSGVWHSHSGIAPSVDFIHGKAQHKIYSESS
jgi:hypothetical protein